MRSGILPILIVLSGTACHTMRPLPLDQLSAQRPRQVRVIRTDDSVVVLSGPHIVNNRLAGFVDDEYQVFAPEDVKQIVVRRTAGGRTAALLATGAAGAVGLMYVLAGSGGYQHPCTYDTGKCDPTEVP